LRLISLRGIENIRYQCGKDYELPAVYIGFEVADAICLQKIINRLSLEKSEFYLYAGSNPPDWWPEEITGRGETEEIRRIGNSLRASGDLVTYKFNQEIKDISVSEVYLIELYHYPKKKKAFYVKRWVGVSVSVHKLMALSYNRCQHCGSVDAATQPD
jgi:hypothetical protein